ncbi:MAG: DUF1329 domain-containing protein [Candidatus Binataceae bacterium]
MKLGAEAEYVIEVGPTKHFGLPKQFLDDTEKHRGQERLVPSTAGGYTLSPLPGALSGLPFGTDPTDPERGYKIMYNWWLSPSPRITHFTDYDWFIDRYRNVARVTSDVTIFRLSHLSDANFPPALSYAHGYLGSERVVVAAPEQMKYMTSLRIVPEDPATYPESYTFLPSQRHSLRTSTAARCKPVPPSDFLEDDLGFQYANFKVAYLGLKKMLTRIQDLATAFEPGSYYVNASFPGWPKAGTGMWELRDHYVIDIQPLPVMGTYCYGHRVMYIDKETWVNDLIEIYDADGKFWKLFWQIFAPIRYGSVDTLIYPTGRAAYRMLDFRSNHASLHVQQHVTFDEQVPGPYRNAEELALPAGLQQVLQ